jgi:hypothetical protein
MLHRAGRLVLIKADEWKLSKAARIALLRGIGFGVYDTVGFIHVIKFICLL